MKTLLRITAALALVMASNVFATSAQLWLDGDRPAILLETDVEIQVTGLLGRAEVRQRFVNDSDDWVEGRYVFPLPDTASVDALTLRIGNRLIVGAIQEREQARQTYNQARDSGHRAGLVEQQRPNLFTTHVANIGPGEEVEIIIGFDQPVKFEDNRFSLHFPMTTVPRYTPAGSVLEPSPDDGEVAWPVRHPDSDPVNPLNFSATLNPGIDLASVTSSHHRVRVERQGGLWQVELLETTFDRDLELIWKPARPAQAHTAVFTERFDGEDYVMVMLLPPHKLERRPKPREVILIIDTSGSMHGQPMVAARESLLFALDTLGADDYFNVIEFNHQTRALFPRPLPATFERLSEASRFVNRLEAGGGTVMGPALELAMAGDPPPDYLRQIVFITDGAISNEHQVLADIRNGIGAARLFNVGIGHGVNHHFLRTGARYGRGSYTAIAEDNQIVERMSELVVRLENPAISDIILDWPETAEAYPARLPDLYVGEPLVAVAKVEQIGGTLLAGGWQGGGVWQQELSLDGFEHAPGVARLWARKRIESLADSRYEGAGADEIEQAITQTALKYQLLSPYTSLVAVDRTPARRRDEALAEHALALNLPHGRTGFHPMAATATGKAQKLGRGLVALALLLLLVLGRWANDESRSGPGR